MSTIDTIPRAHKHDSDVGALNRATVWARLLAALSSAIYRLEDRFAKRRSRLALLELTDVQLKDIGLSRTDAHGEATRSFWD